MSEFVQVLCVVLIVSLCAGCRTVGEACHRVCDAVKAAAEE